MAVPPEWQRLPVRAGGIAGVERQATLVFDPASYGLSARVVVTLAPLESIGSPSLVPKSLRVAAERLPGPPRSVRLAGRRAWMYTAVPVRRRDATMDITVLPTTAGVVAIACLAPRIAFAAAAGCESTLRLTLDGARPMVPARDLGFKLRLGGVAKRLDQERVEQRAALSRARTPGAQALAARRLAAAHARAARALGPLARKGAPVRLVALLRGSSRAYGRLMTSATNRDRAAFVRASRSIEKADDRLTSTLATLGARRRTGA